MPPILRSGRQPNEPRAHDLPSRVRVAWVIVLALTGLCLSGCATSGERESELPWNMPQGWETAPGLPGFDNRGAGF